MHTLSPQSALSAPPCPTAGRPDAASAEAPGSPVFTRRSVLKAGGLISLAGLLSGQPMLRLGGATPAFAAGPTPKPRAAATLPQPSPFQVQASCELSEDYFMTDQVIVGDGDRVMPFARADGTVEAILLTSGVLAHLARDAGAVSGWTYTVISTGLASIVDAAVAASAAQGVSVMVVGPQGSGPDLPAAIVALGSDGAWSVTSSGVLPNFGGARISGGVTAAGDLYWYGWTQQVVDDQYVYQFGKWDGSGPGVGVGNGRYVARLSFPASSETVIVNAVMLYDARPGADVPGFLVVTEDSKDFAGGYQVVTFNQTGTGSSGSFASAPATPSIAGVGFLNWAYCTPTSTSAYPGILWQGTNDVVAFQDETGAVSYTGSTGVISGYGQVAPWLLDGRYAFTYVDGGVAQAVTQFGAGTNFTPPIPLSTGIDQVYSLPTDPTRATLFAVGADQTLNVLTKDPATGWAQVPVHQDGASLQQLAAWRTQISVLDANGNGVANAQIQLSADQIVGVWLPTGNIVLSGTPVFPVTDASGRLTLSIPATELDTAGLTVQALNELGDPDGLPFPITPDVDVHLFLAGGSSLTDIGQLDGPALQNAQNAGGDPLLPALGSLPGSQQATAATAIAGALQHAAALGLGSAPTDLNGVQSAKFDLTGAAPSFQTSTDPGAFDNLSAVKGINDWWDSAKNDAESAYHGLRHGAVKFKTMVTTWADDVKQWTINLVVDIGNGLDNLMNWVIKGIDDAVHAISSFFHALGADINDALAWLRHNVLGLIKDADANASLLQSWLAPFFTTLTNTIDTIEIDTDTFFTNLETQAGTQIAALAALVETAEFGSSAPLPPPTPDTGSRDADLAFKVGQDLITFMRHSPANWLLDKLRAYLPAAPSDGGPTFSALDADLQQIVQDLLAVVADAVDLIESITTALWDAVKPFVTDAGTFNQTSMGAFFTALQAVVDDALKLVNAVLVTLLDAMKAAVAGIQDLLAYEFQAVPFIGGLLELAGIDTTLSIERILCLIAAYPTTLLNNIIGGGPLFPADSTPPTDSPLTGKHGPKSTPTEDPSRRFDGWAVGLNMMSAVVQFVWSSNDLILDGAATTDPNHYAYFGGNALTTSIDIICPVLINLLQWPSPASESGLTQPFWAGTNDQGGQTGLVPWMLFTAFIPPAAGTLGFVAQRWKWEGEEDYNNYAVPVFCTLAGVANTVLSSIYGHAQGVNPVIIAFGVLANISYDVAPLGWPALNKTEDSVPALAKLFIDAVANFGTTIGMFGQSVGGAIRPLVPRIPL